MVPTALKSLSSRKTAIEPNKKRGYPVKQKLNFLGFMLLIIFLISHCAQQKDTPKLTGFYLGQEPPGMTPELFEPTIVSTGLDELNSVFSPDGREFYFCVREFLGAVSIFQMTMERENWSQPKLLPFASRYGDIDVTMSPDGNNILFSSRRPIPGSDEPNENYDFWMAERQGNTWGEPIHLGNDINSDSHDFYPMMTNSRAIYFSSQREGPGTNNIYRSALVDGKYAEAVKLSDAINTEYREFDPYISPEESMLIFTSERPEGLGSGDLYISFRDEEGNWTKAKNLGDKINTPGSEYCSMISPNGKYLFFTSAVREGRRILDQPFTYEDFKRCQKNAKNGLSDIYWVDAKVIETLKPKSSR
jgi:Tol biopolymer transport system component